MLDMMKVGRPTDLIQRLGTAQLANLRTKNVLSILSDSYASSSPATFARLGGISVFPGLFRLAHVDNEDATRR